MMESKPEEKVRNAMGKVMKRLVILVMNLEKHRAKLALRLLKGTQKTRTEGYHGLLERVKTPAFLLLIPDWSFYFPTLSNRVLSPVPQVDKFLSSLRTFLTLLVLLRGRF